MAIRRPLWPDLSSLLSALETSLARPPLDDSPTLGDLVAVLSPEGQEIVSGWLAALSATEGSANRARTCCNTQTVRRMWTWLRAPALCSARDLARIEQEHLCLEPVAM